MAGRLRLKSFPSDSLEVVLLECLVIGSEDLDVRLSQALIAEFDVCEEHALVIVVAIHQR